MIDQEDHVGGEAMNTATALCKWGAKIQVSGNPLGQSEEANWIRNRAAELELPFQDIPESSVKLPICDIYVTSDGDRTMFGLNFTETGKFCQPNQIDLSTIKWITADAGNQDATQTLLQRAIHSEILVYAMDLNPPNNLPNGSFWQTSTDNIGQRGNIQSNLKLVKRMILEKNLFCIHSDGANGFIAGGPNQPPRHYAPFPASLVLDTTGAGDCFRAGMIYGLQQDWKLADCLKFASAAGCLNCRAFGATDGLPSVKEVQDLISANPQIAQSYE